jgi:hypothetical protein
MDGCHFPQVDTHGNPAIAQIRQNDLKSAKTDLEGVPASSHLKHHDYWFILPNCAVSMDPDKRARQR